MKKKAKGAKPTTKKVVKTKAKPTAKKSGKTKQKLDKTHIIAILDKSGSMQPVAQAAISGFNEFLNGQKKIKGKATMDVILFSDYTKYTVVHDGVDIQSVPELNNKTYVPDGMTALYDAIAKATTTFQLKLNNMKPSQKPEKVLVVIVTDGAENNSQEFPKGKVDEIKALILKRKTENWQFLFICSTEDTALTGEALGISKGNTLQFVNTNAGNSAMYATLNSASASYRKTNLKSQSFAKVSENLISDVDDDKNA